MQWFSRCASRLVHDETVSDLRHVACRSPSVRRTGRIARTGLAIGAGTLITVGPVQAASDVQNDAVVASDRALLFDQTRYMPLNVTIDGKPVAVRWYKEICYVSKPVLMAATQVNFGGQPTPIANPRCGYQSMNIYVSENAVGDRETALYFGVSNAGWFASYVRASVTDGATFNSATSNVAAALKAGYVYIDVGTRGRGIVAADGSQAGKAPAVVIDAKAAIRYLRLNDDAMPGSASRIVVNGTSGGGALSAIVGASGNSPDYLPYLAAIGAAGIDPRGHSTIRDDVFAINAYCPITDLGNADVAYEWLYSVLGTRKTVGTILTPRAAPNSLRCSRHTRRVCISPMPPRKG